MSSDDDNDSVEGAIARNMFRTDDDSSSDEEDDLRNAACNSTTEIAVEEDEGSKFVQYPIMDILLEEQRFGGSIAQQLWPAAEYLARFVIEQKESLRGDDAPISIIELGAGVGLTGLQLATQFKCRVLLTDLPEAMPLLERNIELNRDRYMHSESAVAAQVLYWGNAEHIEQALSWVKESNGPVLILASDCVYFQELHEPLEQTLLQLLEPLSASTNATLGCWIAGMRRWKRDNAFYANLGRQTRTATHELTCDCLQETVSRHEGSREIIRVYSIAWNERSSESGTNKSRHHQNSKATKELSEDAA